MLKMSLQTANFFRIANVLIECAIVHGEEVCIRINEDNEFVFSIVGSVYEAQVMVMDAVACHISIYNRASCTDDETIFPVADDIGDYGLRTLIRSVLTKLAE